MKKLLLFLILLPLSIFTFAAKVIPLPELLNPETLTVDKNQVYITQQANIYIYLLKDFSLLKKFGKAGEGPQEFKIYPTGTEAVIEQSDTILVNSIGKVSYFKKNGEFIKEIKTKYPFGRFKPIAKKFVGLGEDIQNKIYFQTVNLFNYRFEKIKEIYRRRDWAQEGTGNQVVDAGGVIVRCFGNKIFIGDREKNTIYVFDSQGKQIYSIFHEYEKIKVTEDHKKKYHNYYRTHPYFKNIYENYQKYFKFPKFFPGIRDITIDKDKIYVLTFKNKENKSEFVILNLNGKLIKQLFLAFKDINIQNPCPYAINNGLLYQLIENEEKGEWELHIEVLATVL